MENLKNSNERISPKKWNFSKFAPILAGALFLMNPNGANAQNVSNQNNKVHEIYASTIITRLNNKLGVSLPEEYTYKVLDFVLNDTIMRTRSATSYTEKFIINEMKKDRGISKQNQLLFIRSKIYAGISKKTLYDRLDDEDVNRSGEYDKSLEKINKSYEEYKKGFKTYMETKSAEARQQSAESKRKSAEARQQSAEARQQSAESKRKSAEYEQQSAEAIKEIINSAPSGIKEIVKYYNLCIKSPETNDENEMKNVKEAAKIIIQTCKKYGIDYKALILKEVGDKKKVDNVLKFYDIK